MIQLREMEKRYKDFELKCSLEVKPGRITGLIGENGAGKSTTFKSILGLVYPDSGSVEVFGKSVEQLTAEDREDMGVVLSDSMFSGYLFVKDIIPVLNAMYKKFQKEAFIQNCKKYRIPLDKKIKEFSTGMKTKLKLLVALSHEAKLLILDEPTSGLDVVVREEVLTLLHTYMEKGERAILISSHISSDLESLCDDFYMIHDGRIVLHEETNKILDSYGIIKTTPEEYSKLEKSYIMKMKKESYGYRLLTNERQFYMDNYPGLTVEKGNFDEMILLMVRGENV